MGEDKPVLPKLGWNRRKEVKGIYSSQSEETLSFPDPSFFISPCLWELVGKVCLQQAAGLNCHKSNQAFGEESTGENICGSSQEISPYYQLFLEKRAFIRAGHNRHAPGCSASVGLRRGTSSKGAHPLLQMSHLAWRFSRSEGNNKRISQWLTRSLPNPTVWEQRALSWTS